MASMSVRNECSKCGEKFLASCESLCKKCSPQNLPKADAYSLLGEGWRDVRKELPVTPFLAYWSDDRITVIEDGDSVSYALTGDPDKRIIAWIPLSEIGEPAFA